MRGLTRILDRTFPWVFWAFVVLSVAILLAALIPVFLHPTPPAAGHAPPRDAADQIALLIGHTASHTEDTSALLIDYALSALNLGTGLFLFLRRPHDPVARLLAVGMVGTSVAFNYQGHALFVGEAELYVQAQGDLPIAPVLSVLHLAYHGLSGAAYTHAFLLFPNGILTPRWLRWAVVGMYFLLIEEAILPGIEIVLKAPLGGVILIVLTVAFATVKDLQGHACTPAVCGPTTPITFDFTAIVSSDVAFFIAFFGFFIPVAGIFALRARRHLLTPIQRAQSEVVVVALSFALAVGFVAMLVSVVLIGLPATIVGSTQLEELRDLALKVFPPLYAVIPLSVVVAILRYRLFDIDRFINRALVYGALSLILAVTYASSVVLLQSLLHPFIPGSELAVAGATLVIVGLFQPLRSRIQMEIDRRFYRERYDAARTLDAFSARLTRELDLEALRADLCGVVHDTVEPSHVSLWLRAADR